MKTTQKNSEANNIRNEIKISKGPYFSFLKRVFDFVLSLLAIICLSPILLIVYVVSFIVLKGNPIFAQKRIGKNGKVFTLYKFRSMSNKRDKDGNLLPDSERLTTYGKILRKTSIDELPQLINILKGDMAVIGPRPRMVEECVFLEEEQKARFLVRPGITGWAQVNGRNSITFDKVVELDKEYVEKGSFKMDVKIFFKTIACVFNRKGVNKEGTVSNELYGDLLLRTGKIEKDYYNEKLFEASKIKGGLEVYSVLNPKKKFDEKDFLEDLNEEESF